LKLENDNLKGNDVMGGRTANASKTQMLIQSILQPTFFVFSETAKSSIKAQGRLIYCPNWKRKCYLRRTTVIKRPTETENEETKNSLQILNHRCGLYNNYNIYD